jgi:kumamolisin
VSTGTGIASETVWNDGPTSATGGGFSIFFARPAYQAQLHAPGTTRGLPDVAGNADPQTGYRVRVDGVDTVVGGTSAVAPLWAGFAALWNQATGRRAGLLNPLLYLHAAHEAGAFQDITHGNNGSFSAGPGWDACSGWGTPDVSKLLSVIEASQPAHTIAAAIGRSAPL